MYFNSGFTFWWLQLQIIWNSAQKLKAAPIDVISNKGHVSLCTWFVPRDFHGSVYLV